MLPLPPTRLQTLRPEPQALLQPELKENCESKPRVESKPSALEESKPQGQSLPSVLEESKPQGQSLSVLKVGHLDQQKQSPAKPAAQQQKHDPKKNKMGVDGYDIGYDDELCKAWRRPLCDAKAAPEFAQKVFYKPDDDEMQQALAIWCDGMETRLPGLLVGDVKAREGLKPLKVHKPLGQAKGKAQPRGSSGDDVHWWEKMDDAVVRVVWLKAERIASLRVKPAKTKEKQVCQCSMKQAKTKEAAIDVMKQVAAKYISGLATKEKLFLERDSLLKDMVVKAMKRVPATEAKPDDESIGYVSDPNYDEKGDGDFEGGSDNQMDQGEEEGEGEEEDAADSSSTSESGS